MRLLIMAALSAWTVGYSGVASAQTVAEPAPVAEATAEETAPPQSSWYGEPLAVNGQDVGRRWAGSGKPDIHSRI